MRNYDERAENRLEQWGFPLTPALSPGRGGLLACRPGLCKGLRGGPGMRLVIGHLYPRLMNMYADRGNVICLESALPLARH